MRERATATLTTVIVDDEQLASDELAYLLRDFPEVEVVATGRNGLEAVQLIRKTEPDLVFLDVQMPGQDGMSVVRDLRESGMELPHFIFVTAYDQYAVEAFRLEAMDYLLKPVDKARLAETIERALRSSQERRAAALETPAAPTPPSPPHRTKLLIRNANRNFIVDAQDVIYATKRGRDGSDSPLYNITPDKRARFRRSTLAWEPAPRATADTGACRIAGGNSP